MHAAFRRPLVLSALAAVVVASVAASAPAGAVVDPSSTVFINELHYDNTGTDAGEAVEIAAPAGTDLTGWTVVLYNGNGGTVYDTDALSGVVAGQAGGFGTVVLTYPTNGIQNGEPDGLALVDPLGAVEQFLSYEGTFAAVGGPANGLTSTDIGVAQAGTEPVGSSLALTGTGGTYGSFTWTATGDDSFGSVNPGQTFSTSGPAEPVATCPAPLTTPQGTAASADVSATDSDSTIESIAITSAEVEGITLTDHGDGTATLDVAATTPPTSFAVEITFTTDDEQTATCTIMVSVLEITPISEVQGNEAASPRAGEDVLVESRGHVVVHAAGHPRRLLRAGGGRRRRPRPEHVRRRLRVVRRELLRRSRSRRPRRGRRDRQRGIRDDADRRPGVPCECHDPLERQ